MIEIPGHPFFIGCQFHPELKSRLLAPHPLFNAFVKASLAHRGTVAAEKPRASAKKPRREVKDDLPEINSGASTSKAPSNADVPPRNGVHKAARTRTKATKTR